MLIDNIKLNAITTGTKLKTFNIDIGGVSYTYFGDIETTDSLNDNLECNKYCAYNLYNKHIIHNLYRSDKVGILSSTRFLHVTDTLEDYIRVFIPDFTKDQIIKTCQNESFTYVLTKPTTNGFKFDYYFDNDGLMSTRLSMEDIFTYLYNPISGNYSSISSMIDDELIDLSVAFNLTFNIKNIKYNYVIEIPNEYIYNYYDDGIILGDGINTKNHLAYDYTMHMKSNIQDNAFNISASYNLVLFDSLIPLTAYSIAKNLEKGLYDIECQCAIYRTRNFSDFFLILSLVNETGNIVRYFDGESESYVILNLDLKYNAMNIICVNGIYYLCSNTADGKFAVLSSQGISQQFTSIESLSSVSRIFSHDNMVFVEDAKLDNNSNLYITEIDSSFDIALYKTWKMASFGTYLFSDYAQKIKNVNGHTICIFDKDAFVFDKDTNKFNPIIANDDNLSNIEDIIYIEDLRCYIAFGKGYYIDDKTSNAKYYLDFIKFSFDLSAWININYDFTYPIKYCYYSKDEELLYIINDRFTKFAITKFNITKWNNSVDNNLVIYFGHNRNYIDINKRGDTMYLKYTTPVNYEIKTIEQDGVEIPISRSLDKYASYNNIMSDIKNIVAYDTDISPSYVDMYQKVEVIKSINRFKQVLHKSNLYAILINDSGINTLLSSSYRQLIKDDIENNIRDIIKSIAPANTQFINIKWTGK